MVERNDAHNQTYPNPIANNTFRKIEALGAFFNKDGSQGDGSGGKNIAKEIPLIILKALWIAADGSVTGTIDLLKKPENMQMLHKNLNPQRVNRI
jgi:hypothetical protein